MSLHALATNMASKGRNGDSMLVHMTPSEVHGLQALAMKHGGSLTINPDTGLPEANFLKSLLPMIAGFALGPAGFGLMSSAMGAGALVGGLTGIATGSLSKGLMAGLGAYGGFGIGEGLLGAGGQELAASGTPIAENIASTAGTSVPPIEQINPSNFNFSNADKLSAGITGLGTETGRASLLANMGGVKGALTTAGMAAAPIAADLMVPTTTKMPTNPNPAYIRQYVTGDRPQAPRALAPVLASEWGARSFQDAYRGAEGGIVALANGGAVQHFEIGGDVKGALENAYATAQKTGDYSAVQDLVAQNQITAADVGSAWKGFDTSGLAGLGVNLYNPTAEKLFQETGSWDAAAKARDDAANAANAATWNQQNTDKWNAENQAKWAAQPVQYTENQMGAYLTAHPEMTIDEAIKATNADRTAVNKFLAKTTGGFKGSTETTGGSGTLGIYNQWNAMGVSPDEYYAAALANDPKYAGWTKEMLQKGFNLDKGAYALSSQLGGKVSDKDWVKFMDDNSYSINDAAQAFGLSLKEVRDRYNAVKNAEKKTTVTGTGGLGALTTAGPVTDTTLPTNWQTNAPAGTSNPYGNKNNPGDLTFNPDGTVTVQPNLPGRPYGGYSGITELTNAYTAGGGSTGYTSPVVKTAAEHDATYNKMTDDSLDAYNYLIGKGGAKYPSKSRATEIMKPYEEAVLGYPSDITKKKYINVNGKMVLNPQYVAPKTLTQKNSEASAAAATAAKAGKPQTISVTDSNSESNQTITAVLQDDGTYLGGNGKKYTAAGVEIMAQGGMAGYSVGGGLGSLGSYSDGGRLLKGPGDGVSDSIPATIGRKQQPARLADGEFVVPARIVSELGNGSTDAGAKKLYAMMDRVQRARGKTTGKNKVAANSRADKYLPA